MKCIDPSPFSLHRTGRGWERDSIFAVPLLHRWCVCCSPSGGNSLVRGLQDDASHLVGMGEEWDVAGRDFTRSGLTPLRHPAVVLDFSLAPLDTCEDAGHTLFLCRDALIAYVHLPGVPSS
jgi:hypothetical protein